MMGIVEASSLEGYTFEGWKRFFIEAFFFVEQRYDHQLELNFSNVEQKVKDEKILGDGLISFGPKLSENTIYQLLKSASEYVSEDVVSIYRGVNDKHVYLQLGGY